MYDKNEIRRLVRLKKREMTPEQIERTSEKLASRLFEHEAYKNARSVYCYISYNQEVRTDAIMRRARADGMRVAVPKITDGEMVFIWLDDPDAVAPGYGGIQEPVADSPVADDEEALVIMPGLAFDGSGNRIGYGGGFYDRYLAAHRELTTVALCYGFQVFGHIETDARDGPADYVISEEV